MKIQRYVFLQFSNCRLIYFYAQIIHHNAFTFGGMIQAGNTNSHPSVSSSIPTSYQYLRYK